MKGDVRLEHSLRMERFLPSGNLNLGSLDQPVSA